MTSGGAAGLGFWASMGCRRPGKRSEHMRLTSRNLGRSSELGLLWLPPTALGQHSAAVRLLARNPPCRTNIPLLGSEVLWLGFAPPHVSCACVQAFNSLSPAPARSLIVLALRFLCLSVALCSLHSHPWRRNHKLRSGYFPALSPVALHTGVAPLMPMAHGRSTLRRDLHALGARRFCHIGNQVRRSYQTWEDARIAKLFHGDVFWRSAPCAFAAAQPFRPIPAFVVGDSRLRLCPLVRSTLVCATSFGSRTVPSSAVDVCSLLPSPQVGG